jgi:hypothetical protein
MSAPQGTILYTLDGTDPREVGGAVSAAARVWNDAVAVTLRADSVVKARVRVGESWSALAEANFVVGPAVSPDTLRFAEVHYHPAPPSPAEMAAGFTDGDDFELIELLNTGAEAIDLSSVHLVRLTQAGDTVGVDFDFGHSPVTRLAPDQRVLVVEDTAGFRQRYGRDLLVAGQWSGGLGNGGELITLQLGDRVLQQFAYDDAWYATTDGGGCSLEIVDANQADLSRWTRAEVWLPSALPGGTPGGPRVV